MKAFRSRGEKSKFLKKESENACIEGNDLRTRSAESSIGRGSDPRSLSFSPHLGKCIVNGKLLFSRFPIGMVLWQCRT